MELKTTLLMKASQVGQQKVEYESGLLSPVQHKKPTCLQQTDRVADARRDTTVRAVDMRG
ncbi:MAG: hypothetical protein FRX49_07169 [Trebouxia sp. A1-2]|nr:MAG: hypothetical protein FRX49_07169 [Trebouxia sp. A1-2]